MRGHETASSALGGKTGSQANGEGTFGLTSVAEEDEFRVEDLPILEPYKAHEDAINWVTYVADLHLVATASFDFHVYIWDFKGERPVRMGSLVLGNRVVPDNTKLDAEARRMKSNWRIVIDKLRRYELELQQAKEVLETVETMDYNQLRAKAAQKKGSTAELENNRPIASQLKGNILKNKQRGVMSPQVDEFEGKTPEEADNMILNNFNK